jgi:uroporphyrin-III C-methyltransferase / precorrin-2 dehydrogenase / sirohydrochlorin ferrochelatase
MQHLPIFFDVKEQLCVVIGGGEIATRKVALLLRAQARVRVIAPQLCTSIQRLLDNGRIEYVARGYQDGDLEDAVLAIGATDDEAVNQDVARAARARHIPVNVVDNAHEGNFIMPSIIDRSPVVAAVSTGGASPVLARLIRTRLESLIPAGYGRLAELAAKFRGRVREKFADANDRRRFWDCILQGGVAERVFSGHMDDAERLMEKELDDAAALEGLGEVYLVGAGPGDPDLLTFRALRLMQQADVVVYDRLVAKPILDMTRRDARRVYVGKERDNHAMRQEQINQLLADLAKEGHRVLRLKGGDPFIFGRGGEEIDTLAE